MLLLSQFLLLNLSSFLFFFFFSFLAKRGVKDEICSFDARKITPDIRASVEELLQKNANSFDPKVRAKMNTVKIRK